MAVGMGVGLEMSEAWFIETPDSSVAMHVVADHCLHLKLG